MSDIWKVDLFLKYLELITIGKILLEFCVIELHILVYVRELHILVCVRECTSWFTWESAHLSLRKRVNFLVCVRECTS